jgi:hypothetical protein
MSHKEQQNFIKLMLERYPHVVNSSSNILEVGSQAIWGSPRHHFPSSKNYLGIDLGKSSGVDLVVPGELFQLPDGWADICISAECFEHAREWSAILSNMIRVTKEDGLILITCAGQGRATHGTIDTDIESSPFTTSYYKNLSPSDIENEIDLHRYFKLYGFEVDSQHCDTYFWGRRNSSCDGCETMNYQDALARARGQVGMMANEILLLKSKLDDLEKKRISRRILRAAKNLKNRAKLALK